MYVNYIKMLTQFKTQDALKKHIQTIFKDIGICDSIQTEHPRHFDTLCELFTRHPDYPDKVKGLVDIKRKRNPQFPNLELCVVYADGRCEDISYTQCITGKRKNNLKDAMRVAIQPQIDDYRSLHEAKCNSKECNHPREIRFEVDHVVHFEQLYQEFFEQNKDIQIPTEFDETEGHSKCFRREDKAFEDAWSAYHKDNAVLQILCGPCNRSRPHYKKVAVTITKGLQKSYKKVAKKVTNNVTEGV